VKPRKILILGAGITGLRTAEYLAAAGNEVTLVEKANKIGGMSGSFKHGEFILDHGPHKFYSQLDGVYKDFESIVGAENYLTVKKKNSLRLLGKYFDFPVKLSQLMTNINPILSAEILIDFTKQQFSKSEVVSYEDYFIKGFGKKGYSILFKGFAEKVWGDPRKISEELGRKRSPAKNVFDVIKTLLVKNDKNVNAEFFLYPKKGMGVLCENLADRILEKKGKIFLESVAKKINFSNGRIKSVEVEIKNRKKKIECDILISTIPLNELMKIATQGVSKRAVESASELKYRSLIVSYIVLNKTVALKDNWIFFPEKEFHFSRVAEQKSFSPFTSPENKTIITAELPCEFNSELYNSSDESLRSLVVRDLEKAGLAKNEEVLEFFTKKADKVYPVYEIGYKQKLNSVLEELDKIENLFTIGRLGLFNYNNIDHCLDMAKLVAEIINEDKRSEWKKARDYFENYRIVD
jgi:protoporphyrinogen oxidase